jgi:glutathione S-transferase
LLHFDELQLAAFAARGGSKGGKNPRKTFQAPLADPYANPDEDVLPLVDAALRIVCQALLSESVDDTNLKSDLVNAVPSGARGDVVQSLIYLRERVGVPRDMPLAAARYLRAQLNWAIDSLNG